MRCKKIERIIWLEGKPAQMNTYSYFTAPTEDFAHEFCYKCTSSYGCVCDLLVQHGHCPTCMNMPSKCLCNELKTSQSMKPVQHPINNYFSWNQPPSTRVDPLIDQIKQLMKDLATPVTTIAVTAPITAPITDPITDPITYIAPTINIEKWQMNYFWKKACAAEGVHFTRKEHCAYPRVLATYHRLRKEYDERDEKLMKERSSGW